MKNSKTWIKFYESLAFLGYSTAAADKNIHAREIEMLKQLLRKEWLELEDSVDEFGSDTAFQTEAVFDWLLENRPAAEYAFEKFQSFIKEHPAFADEKLKKRIFITAENIADAFGGKNKAELTLLFRLEKLLTESVKNAPDPNLSTKPSDV